MLAAVWPRAADSLTVSDTSDLIGVVDRDLRERRTRFGEVQVEKARGGGPPVREFPSNWERDSLRVELTYLVNEPGPFRKRVEPDLTADGVIGQANLCRAITF
ncbi:MAG: hypothetical protein R2735_06765 [Microthrixaceae bacterium]